MTISQRIFELLEQKDKKQKDLAAAVGISTSAISDWKKKNTNPSADNLSAIADFLDVSLEFLITGINSPSESMSWDEQQLLGIYRKLSDIDKAKVHERALTLSELSIPQKHSNSSFELLNNKLTNNKIKLFDTSVSAGTGIDIDYSTHTEITTSEDVEGADFAVRVSGDSMVPRFHNRDIVLVESTPSVEVGEIGIFILNGQAYIKELGENKLISLNKKYTPIEITENDSIYCQGKVIKILTTVQEV